MSFLPADRIRLDMGHVRVADAYGGRNSTAVRAASKKTVTHKYKTSKTTICCKLMIMQC